MLKKRLKRSKKGLSHVDWAMSLSIFLLYLAWFFIFVKPQLVPSENIDVLMDVLDEGLEDEIYKDIERVKVKVSGNSLEYGEYEPIIIPFTKDWNKTEMAHTAEYFEVDDGKMFFLGNLSETDEWSIYHPHEALKHTKKPIVIADEEETEYEDFRAEFEDHSVKEIYFDGEKRLWDFKIEVDETEMDNEGQFEHKDIMVKYMREGLVNHTTYVFAKNPRLYSYVEPADNRNHTIKVKFTGYNYTDYFLGAERQGEISYRIMERCTYYESNKLDLYEANSGMAILAGKNITFKLCTNETNTKVEMEFQNSGEDAYKIFLHRGEYREIEDQPLKMLAGTTETLTTTDQERVSYLKNRDYNYLKELFGYPDARDFNVTISSEPVKASYGKKHPRTQNVYARKKRSFIIDRDFQEKQVNISMTVW